MNRSSTRRPHVCLSLLTTFAACGASPTPSPAPADLVIPPRFTAVAEAAVAELRPDWWQDFADPELDRFVARCLEHNRDVQAAFARLQAATATRTIQGADSWPQVDAALDAQRSQRLFLGFPFGSGGVPSSTTTTFGLSLSVRWELDVWGRIAARESAAIADTEVAQANVAGAQLSLAGQACRAWFAVAEAAAQRTLAAATVDAFRATADDVRDRYRRGVRPALDVHLAATNVASAEATLAQREETLQRARRRLDVLAGRYPDANQTPAVFPRTLPPIPAALPGELLQRRPDLVAAERRLAAAGCRVDAARASLYPRLSLTGSGGTTSEELEDLVDEDFRIWSIGANLLAPLFRAGALRAEVRRNEALVAEAAATYGGAVLAAFAEVEDVLASDALLAARFAGLTRAAEHASAAHDLARSRYQGGLVDFLTVADTQRQSFLAAAAQLAAERQRLENRVDLFLALGGGYRSPDTGAKP